VAKVGEAVVWGIREIAEGFVELFAFCFRAAVLLLLLGLLFLAAKHPCPEVCGIA